MKTLIASLTSAAVLIGCSTSQQSTAFKTIASAESTVNLANDSYDALVIKGAIATNTVPQVKKLYNDFQAAELLALDAVQFNTNAVTPPALIVEGQDFVNLVNSIKLQIK
jgi:hypothetical protein